MSRSRVSTREIFLDATGKVRHLRLVDAIRHSQEPAATRLAIAARAIILWHDSNQLLYTCRLQTDTDLVQLTVSSKEQTNTMSDASVLQPAAPVARTGKTMSEALLNEKVRLRSVLSQSSKTLKLTTCSGTAASLLSLSARLLVLVSESSSRCCSSRGERGLHGLDWALELGELGKSAIAYVDPSATSKPTSNSAHSRLGKRLHLHATGCVC